MKKFFIRFFIVALCQSRRKLSTTEVFSSFRYCSTFSFLFFTSFEIRFSANKTEESQELWKLFVDTECMQHWKISEIKSFFAGTLSISRRSKAFFLQVSSFFVMWSAKTLELLCALLFSFQMCFLQYCVFVLYCPLQPGSVISQLFGVDNNSGY